MKEIILDLPFAQRYWKEVMDDLEKLYNDGYRKAIIHILDADDLTYEMLAEEAQYSGFWVKLIVTGGKKMRSMVRHAKPEEVSVLTDKKGKMRRLLVKKGYIEVNRRWINRKANFGKAVDYNVEEEDA